MVDLFDQIPYNDDGFGKRFLVDSHSIKLIQVALHPGQTIPPHNTNGDINILVLQGELSLKRGETVNLIRHGMLTPVGYNTPMQITNTSTVDATFLIIKTPPEHFIP